ncbi:polysaccharide pyruvyl transferase family protein [Paucibacter soli]|uniref:polysaccharide pyruvyl transferase family protein n=1 Tax=Paucibacter soli TaxID=3133433 RepID=UPI00309BE362
MKIYLTGQNNFGNRGCEALVRSTLTVLRKVDAQAQVRVPSADLQRDSAQWPLAAQDGAEFVPVPALPRRFAHWNRVVSRLPALAALPWPRLPAQDPIRAQLRECDLLLSIGGDNYSLDYDLGSLAYFVAIAEAALEMGKPALLWGASAGPFDRLPAVERRMADHLKRLTAVTVRETHTHAYLKGLGLQSNLHLVADSAFLLGREAYAREGFWPQGEDGVLGLNLSPLVDGVRKRAGAATELLDEAARFIETLMTRSRLGVLLVPHVAPLDGAAFNNDERYLAQLQQRLLGLGPRVRSVPGGLNACQLKDVIAGCRYFIGARTHATIAALSSGVPTVSIAYSIKARGINLDLFDHEDHVLDTRKVGAQSLQQALDGLVQNEAAIRAHLAERLPEWRRRAALGAGVVADLSKD